MDDDELLRVLKAFDNAGLEYVLIGATAMGFHGVVRATGDVDLFVRASPDDIERLRKALLEVYGEDPNVAEIRDEDLRVTTRPSGTTLPKGACICAMGLRCDASS